MTHILLRRCQLSDHDQNAEKVGHSLELSSYRVLTLEGQCQKLCQRKICKGSGRVRVYDEKQPAYIT